jgi:hypothetical protein
LLLTILGAAAELGGLLLVVLDIRADLRIARQTWPVGNTKKLGYAVESDEALPIDVSGGKPPPAEQRLDALEKAVNEQASALRAQRLALEAQITKEATQEAARVQKVAEGYFLRLRRLIDHILQGGLTGRVVGVALFALGVVLSALGNVLPCATIPPVEASFLVLIAGVLLALWDQAFGLRKWQGGNDEEGDKAGEQGGGDDDPDQRGRRSSWWERRPTGS